ncbi:type I restriction enzyme HsdR N-terminal domain-containing protein [Candidatus Clavichlamydia salmonicola]|uniref:type I restriction enzyme HsdR N-terminal domain-containing protein n=1 Tax=Candidatus Clavichlamydia salmonicola TaxID=469812 RepID=UPI001891C72F|nr:type I restriction enzyme HsdR N-terminal domain-containing protein [Candidatus Clavichlamydia salmonicola]
MDSLNYKDNDSDYLYDPVRQLKVKNSPEEKVRQHLILLLSNNLGYPLSFFSIEKQLSTLKNLPPSLSNQKIPLRRIDLLISVPIRNNFETKMAPFLIAECKQSLLNFQAEKQLLSYNFFIRAPFLLLTNGSEIKIGSFDKDKKTFIFKPGLPPHFNEVYSSTIACT